MNRKGGRRRGYRTDGFQSQSVPPRRTLNEGGEGNEGKSRAL